ncbi:small ribosomal subunit protein mS35 [Monosporozyma unispora]
MWPVLKINTSCYRAVTRLDLSVRWVSNNATIPSNLFLSPGEWKNLPPNTILQLHEERKFKLGPNYQPNVDELEALYSTSDFTGQTKNQIKQTYQSHWAANISKKGRQKHIKVKKYSPNELKHGLRPFQFDDLPTSVQEDLDDIKETRYYQRIAAFELPQLIKFRQEYKPVDMKQNPITYKYTTYMGEEHPNSKKVVLSCRTSELGLNDKQLHKFKLLARTRYNFETDQFKMSSEKFNEPLQNAHYLHDIFQKLINESKDLSMETFEDIPLDTRHIKSQNLRKRKNGKTYKFPEEWNRPEDAPKEMINILKEIFN